MSFLTQLTTTAVEAVETVRTKATDVVVDVRKQLPTVEAKKVQSAVVETVGSARKQVIDLVEPATKQVVDLVKPATKQATKQFIDLTARGEQIVRSVTGRPTAKKSSRPATAASTTAARKTTARKTTARKTTVVSPAASARWPARQRREAHRQEGGSGRVVTRPARVGS